MYVVYEHFEYRRKWPIVLRSLRSLPDTVFYIRVLVKVPKRFKRSKWSIFLRLSWSLPYTVLYIRVLVKVPKQFIVNDCYFFIAVACQVASWT